MGESTADAVLELLEGRWQAVYSEVAGQMTAVDEFSSIEQSFSGNEFTVFKGGEPRYEGRFSVNRSSDPNELVLVYTKADDDMFLGGPRNGVVQMEGDTLKMCLGAVGQTGPKDFNTTTDSSAVLTIFQRAVDRGKVLGPARIPIRGISQW
jgi:uncharacterized protein (TIGR03067 family)